MRLELRLPRDRLSAPRRAGELVVISSRRGFHPAGLAASGKRREEVAAPGALPLISERCRVRAEPVALGLVIALRRLSIGGLAPMPGRATVIDLRFGRVTESRAW
jgi:hypothetical protein